MCRKMNLRRHAKKKSCSLWLLLRVLLDSAILPFFNFYCCLCFQIQVPPAGCQGTVSRGTAQSSSYTSTPTSISGTVSASCAVAYSSTDIPGSSFCFQSILQSLFSCSPSLHITIRPSPFSAWKTGGVRTQSGKWCPNPSQLEFPPLTFPTTSLS